MTDEKCTLQGGKRFVVAKPLDRGANTPITVIENWQAALKH